MLQSQRQPHTQFCLAASCACWCMCPIGCLEGQQGTVLMAGGRGEVPAGRCIERRTVKPGSERCRGPNSWLSTRLSPCYKAPNIAVLTLAGAGSPCIGKNVSCMVPAAAPLRCACTRSDMWSVSIHGCTSMGTGV